MVEIIWKFDLQLPVHLPLKLWVWSSWQGVLDTTLYDKVCKLLATGQWFSPGTPIFSTNKTDRHDITEILLKVALNTITQSIWPLYCLSFFDLQPLITPLVSSNFSHFNLLQNCSTRWNQTLQGWSFREEGIQICLH